MEPRPSEADRLPTGIRGERDHSPTGVSGDYYASESAMDEESELEGPLGTPPGDAPAGPFVLRKGGNEIDITKGMEKLITRVDRLLQREFELVLELAGDNTIERDEHLIDELEIVRGKRTLIDEFIEDRRNRRRLF